MIYPTISIGMPAYNCEGTVSQAIASIINQTFKDWELIVYDDGSQDGTLDAIRKFTDPRIRVEAGRQNRGLPRCLNEVIARCNGEYFARMDADDIAYPDRLQSQLEFLRNHQEVDLVGGSILVFSTGGAALGARRGASAHEEICVLPWSGVSMAHPTWMGRTEWFRCNPYDANMVRMEDWELLFRTYQHSKFANLPQILLGYREDSLSLRKILVARRYKCGVMLRKMRDERILRGALSGILGQVARALAETAAIGLGLNYLLLKHRIPPVSSNEVEVWQDVLAKTQGTVLEKVTENGAASA